MVSIIILCYNIIILWDHRRMCSLSLTETLLCDAYLYIQGSQVETQTPTHWSLSSSCISTPLPMVSLAVFHRHLCLIALSFPLREIWHMFKKCCFNFLTYLKIA